MSDGHFSNNHTLIYMNNFMKQDIERVIKVSGHKFGIKATFKKRKKKHGVEV